MIQIKHRETHAVLYRAETASLQTADMRDCELQGADLSYAFLQNARLDGADLTDARLVGAQLRGARLEGACLLRADLTDADLRETDARRADLTGATGLIPAALAGANLTRARLPENLKNFDGLRNVEAQSKRAGALFMALMLACAFTLLTMCSASDVGFFNDTSTATLPLLGTTVSTLIFFWVAPWTLLLGYIALHVELQRLWERLAGLPALFPDGATLQQKAHPWMLDVPASASTPTEWIPAPSLDRLRRLVSFGLPWGAVPCTLILFWGRYLRRHDTAGTVVQAVLIVVSLLVGEWFFRQMVHTLRRGARAPSVPSRGDRSLRLLWRGTEAALLVLLPLFSFGGIHGIPEYRIVHEGGASRARANYRVKDGTSSQTPEGDRILIRFPDRQGAGQPFIEAIRRLVPAVLAHMDSAPFADLTDADVSFRPAGWTGQDLADFALVKGARLRNKDLRYARAVNAFLAKADMTGARMGGAQLSHADLRQANLTGAELNAVLAGAHLEDADLTRADLRHADLTGAYLQGAAGLGEADLEGAQLDEAHLDRGSMKMAHLHGSFLSNAHMRDAMLLRADLRQADLTAADLRNANLQLARMRDARLSDADLSGAFLFETDLTQATLVRAKLSKANMAGAILVGADLSGADLSSAINVTQAQIDSARVDPTTKLPAGIVPGNDRRDGGDPRIKGPSIARPVVPSARKIAPADGTIRGRDPYPRRRHRRPGRTPSFHRAPTQRGARPDGPPPTPPYASG